jgi:outer membrane lipoprotein-sorting protein
MGMIRRSSATSLAGWFVLLAMLLSAVTVTAYAVTRSGAPKPPQLPLARAVHNALSAHPVAGVSAQFTIDQHLLAGGSSTISASPLSGATGSVWVGGGHVRLNVKSQFGTTELAYDGSQVTLYDRKHHVAYVMPVTHHASASADTTQAHSVPTIADIQKGIARLSKVAVVSGAIPSNVAGQKAYTVRASPRHNGGLFGNFELAWDAAHGVPLHFAIYPRGSSTAAIAITATHIQFGAVPSSRLALTLPAGTKIVHVHRPSQSTTQSKTARSATPDVMGTAAVSRAVGFRLAAPAKLAGLSQAEVRSMNIGKSPAALLTYGKGLGTVFVLEQRATAQGQSQLKALPSASIAGAHGRELDTTLGSLVQFTRGGITYTVAGSQRAATIMTAAQALG